MTLTVDWRVLWRLFVPVPWNPLVDELHLLHLSVLTRWNGKALCGVILGLDESRALRLDEGRPDDPLIVVKHGTML